MINYELPERLVSDIAAGRAAPFIGAGLSMGAGYPSWAQFCEELLAELPREMRAEAAGNNLLIAQLYEQTFRRESLVDKLRERFLLNAKAPTPCHGVLARFAWREVYTTNWDELLERALQASNRRVNPVYRAIDLGTSEHEDISLIYLHGSPRQPETITVTARDYYEPSLYARDLFARASNRTLLFLGLSLADRHILQMLTEFAPRPSYAVLFDCPAVLIDFYRVTYNLHVINLEAPTGDKSSALEAFLESLHAAVEDRSKTRGKNTQQIMITKSKKFEATVAALLHEDNAKSENVWVINSVDFARYTNFFVDLIDLMQGVYAQSSLQIYNIYQPLHFFLDMLNEGEEHLRRALPELSKFLERFSTTYFREEQLRLSAEFVHLVFPDGHFVSERAEQTLQNLGRLLFPSLDRIEKFANSTPDGFIRTTILSNDYDGLTNANHFRLFDYLMKTSERHYLVNADEFRTFAKTRYVHGSDFCLWENDEVVAVTDYYPSSHTLVVGWVYKQHEREDPGAHRYVSYFQGIYNHLAKFRNRHQIGKYIANLQHNEKNRPQDSAK